MVQLTPLRHGVTHYLKVAHLTHRVILLAYKVTLLGNKMTLLENKVRWTYINFMVRWFYTESSQIKCLVRLVSEKVKIVCSVFSLLGLYHDFLYGV